MLVLALGAIVGVRYFQRKVQEYADTKPMAIEKGDTSPAKFSAVQKRVDAFREAVNTQSTPQELALTADEINTLLAGQPDLQNVANMVFVIIEGDQLKAKLSFPLDPIRLKGRYFNGTGTFAVDVKKNDVDLRIKDAQTADGKPVPPQFLEPLRRIDFADYLLQDAQTAAALRYADSVEIKDGRVIIRSKPGG